jgi:hypothetical protein
MPLPYGGLAWQLRLCKPCRCSHGEAQSLELTLPPLSALFLHSVA